MLVLLRRALRRRSVLLLPAALLVAGCGSGGRDELRTVSALAETAATATTATTAEFPVAGYRTLRDVVGALPVGPAIEPAVSVLHPGRNRIAFALVDTARKQMTGASVVVYVAHADGAHARGPYEARAESLAVRPAFRSRQTATDADAARGIYVTEVGLGRAASIALVAVAKLDGRLVASRSAVMPVTPDDDAIPDVGDRAPVIHTDIPADVGGDLEQLDTRRPPMPSLHAVDVASVLGHRPVVLVFASPQLCVSRVCAPVVDIAADVQESVGDRVAVVHQEVYRDNDPASGFRPQVEAYGLPTEPWTFVIGRDGRVSARFEGAVSADELRRAVARVAP